MGLGYRFDSDNERFDAVVGSSVLHHLDVAQALRECFRVLKPEGVICFTEPNMLNPQIALQKNISFLKKRLGDSPDETTFFRWQIQGFCAGPASKKPWFCPLTGFTRPFRNRSYPR